MNDSYDCSLPATAAGMASSLVSTMTCSTVGILPCSGPIAGSSVASTNSNLSSA